MDPEHRLDHPGGQKWVDRAEWDQLLKARAEALAEYAAAREALPGGLGPETPDQVLVNVDTWEKIAQDAAKIAAQTAVLKAAAEAGGPQPTPQR